MTIQKISINGKSVLYCFGFVTGERFAKKLIEENIEIPYTYESLDQKLRHTYLRSEIRKQNIVFVYSGLHKDAFLATVLEI